MAKKIDRKTKDLQDEGYVLAKEWKHPKTKRVYPVGMRVMFDPDLAKDLEKKGYIESKTKI